MIDGRVRLSAAVMVVALTATVFAADLKITPLVTPAGSVVASLAMPTAFTPDARDVVKSGLELRFTFVVDVKRPSTFWFDRTLGTTTLVASVKFDSLTGIYQVSKRQDDHVIWSERTDSEDQMRAWMTQIDRLPIPTRDLETNAEYYVQAQLHVSPHTGMSLWPWGRDDGSARADFTFVR